MDLLLNLSHLLLDAKETNVEKCNIYPLDVLIMLFEDDICSECPELHA